MREILLIITGSIAAYKALELVRRLREAGHGVTGILTAGGAEFITPLSVAALTGRPCYHDLFSLKDETEMGHIRLAREHDLIVIAPASADFLAKMATGRADDLASTAALAATIPLLAAPAMNPAMWQHPATTANISTLQERGVIFIDGQAGDMACGEVGLGRMAEPMAILQAIEGLSSAHKPLAGKSALVTAGPTHEPIDPVRFISNRSSGKQGYALAEALANAGASVTLISGPTALEPPRGVRLIAIQTAEEMYQAAKAALPCDIAICAAAVADWKVDVASSRKMKKSAMPNPLSINLIENPDILHAIAHAEQRPSLVIGFAAETESLEAQARDKQARKGCDWMLANDVSDGKVFGEDTNQLLLLREERAETLPAMSKAAAARAVVEEIIQHFSAPTTMPTKEAAHA